MNEINKDVNTDISFDEYDVLLQKELDDMKNEVPPVPESYSSSWRKAVREDAEHRAEADSRGLAAMETAQPKVSRKNRSRRLIPLLSSAAVLIFLIGGTFATRSTLSPRLQLKATEEFTVANKASFERSAVEAYSTEEPDEAVYSTDVSSDEDYSAEMYSPDMYSADMYSSDMNSSDMSASSDLGAGLNSAYDSSVWAYDSYMEAYDFDESAVTTEEAEVEEAEEEAVAEIDAEAAEKAVVEEEAAAVEEEAAAETEEEVEEEETIIAEEDAQTDETEETIGSSAAGEIPDSDNPESNSASKSGFWNEVLFFLEDMGAFLTAALPWLGGVALLCLIIVLIRRR